jgi:hypothetical protein
MTAIRGSFGLLKPRFEITAERVTITRNVGASFALLACGLVGVGFLSQAFDHHQLRGGPFAIGAVGAMLGMFAVVMTPWLAPARITVTPGTLRWGGATYPAQDVLKITALSSKVRVRAGGYLSWSIVVVRANKQVLQLSFGNRQLSADVQPLQALAHAMATVLGVRG